MSFISNLQFWFDKCFNITKWCLNMWLRAWSLFLRMIWCVISHWYWMNWDMMIWLAIIKLALISVHERSLKKIDILIKKNALNWFQQLKSYLHNERLWKIIEQIMIKQANSTRLTKSAIVERQAASAVTADEISETTTLWFKQSTSEETLKSETLRQLEQLAEDK